MQVVQDPLMDASGEQRHLHVRTFACECTTQLDFGSTCIDTQNVEILWKSISLNLPPNFVIWIHFIIQKDHT